MLSRIPAVKWAFNRLRPLPHSGSLDVAPIPADEEPVIEEEVSTSSVGVASETVDAPEVISGDPPAELPTDVEPDVVEEAPISTLEAVAAPEPPSISDSSPELPADVEPVLDELVFIAPAAKTVSVEPSEFVTDEPAFVASVEIEPVAVDETRVVVADAEVPAPVVAETSIDSETAPSVAAEIEPVVANDLPSVAAVVAEETIADAPKPRAKVVEPADRAALIRQRWAETGIRMWNPRLHGTGDAALNIQGRIGLLPPEPGETMPRYDKLEFRMLGGQIVCEGVIVEAPVHASQRSFTRLAEPRGADRAREPVRQRQAALA
ncbi:hypothetical protein [Bradyrhizobium sp. RDM12]